jgi:hypothetical protein
VRRGRGSSGQAGQATVELVAALPLIAAVAVGAGQFLAAGVAREYAGHAAEAGAVAVLQDTDPRKAVRDSLPGWAHDRVRMRVAGDEVRVAVRPPLMLPGLGALLESTSVAYARATR